MSRLLGLWRDIVIASVFGAGALTDAFFAAFRLPNMLRRFTAEGALTQAFVPVYREQRDADPALAAALAGEVAAFLAAFLLLLSVAGALLAPWLILLLAPGLSEQAVAADLFRIVFPYILFISLVALFAGMLNAVGKFYAAACAPMLLNIAMIVATLWLAPQFQQPITALAWGVFVGGVAQLLWVTAHLYRAGLLPRLTLRLPPSPPVRRTLRLFWKSALGAGAAQFNLLINLFIASFLGAGSISWLYYADRLMELPVGLLGASLATVVLPTLAARANDTVAFNALFDAALRLMLFLALPAAVGLACLSLPLVASFFAYGEFSANDVLMTQRAVVAYSVGVLGLSAVRPLAAAFFSRQDATTPVRAALAALTATQLFNALFVWALDWGHVGLALSVGLGASVNAVVLLVVLLRRRWYVPAAGWRLFLSQLVASLMLMSGVLIFILPPDSYWLAATLPSRVVTLAASVGVSGVIYFCGAYIAGIRLANFKPSV